MGARELLKREGVQLPEGSLKMVFVNGEGLTIEDVVAVARRRAEVGIPDFIKERASKSHQALERLIEKRKIVYGVTTGFGALSNVLIPPEEVKELQYNLIRSHATGVGEPLSTDIVRAMMLLRANALAKGYSGVRLKVLETLVEMLNKGVHPIVPKRGSVGASGDLAPLAHVALVTIGEGEAEYEGRRLSGSEAMKEAGIEPLELEAKEGLALINGTQMTTALAALMVHDAEILIKTAEIATALSLEALLGVIDAFDERIHRARPHVGQIVSARNIRSLVYGSELVRSGEEAVKELGYPHDPYSLRCAPQVLGSARDILAYVRKAVEIEINSATDNPLIFAEDGACLSGGNFHGQPIALALDVLSSILAIVASLSERKIARLTDEKLSRGLPAFLVPMDVKAGLHSGFMALQCTAAALASENKALAHPASVDSIPTSAHFEDFVSMGPVAALKAAEALRNAEYVVAIELLCAAQSIEFRGPERLGRGTKLAYSSIRSKVPALREDRPLHKEVEVVRELIRNGEIIRAIEGAVKLL